jgi:hypothetical protein
VLQTSLAADAAPWQEHHVRLERLALWIVAPPAIQGTALEKNRGADARPIVNGKLFYVKDHSLYQSGYLCECDVGKSMLATL